MSKKATLLLQLICALFLVNLRAKAATYTVMNTNDTGAGSFRQAVLDANGNSGLDTILFNPSTNGLSITLNSEVTTMGSLTILGNGILNTRIIPDSGAGIYVDGFGDFIIKNLALGSPGADNPELILAYNIGDGLVENCAFFAGPNTSTLLNSNCPGTFTINDCQFIGTGNSATGLSGFVNTTLIVSNSTFTGLFTGVFLQVVSASLTNCTLANNVRGILMLNDVNLYLLNCTVVNGTESGIYIQESANISMENNILYGSAADFRMEANGNPTMILNTNNIVGVCLDNSTLADCPVWYSSADPQLDPAGLQNNGGSTMTVGLIGLGPSIDNASGNAPALDQRGTARQGTADIGAFEFTGTPPCDPNSLGSFTIQPSDVIACEGDPFLFAYEFTGASDSIFWFVSLDGGTTWSIEDPNLGDTLQVNNADISQNGVLLMAVAYGCGNAFDTTAIVQLTVDTLSTATTVSGITISAVQPNGLYQWINCGDQFPIMGATGQDFTPTENGLYAVMVANGSCFGISDCVEISTIGLEEQSINPHVRLYPNPTKDQLTIAHDLFQPRLRIFDISGKLVQENTLIGNQTTLSLNASEGMYFVEISTNETIEVFQLVIE